MTFSKTFEKMGKAEIGLELDTWSDAPALKIGLDDLQLCGSLAVLIKRDA